GMTGLFANGVSNVNTLVNKINNTEDSKARGALLKELDKELSNMDKKELPAAQEIVNNKLKFSKTLEK
ncbi:restriction endonuclease, partial [Arcobacter sp. F2176]|uniref:restriction endonuclease n=2 Tax=Arcobacter TaxID=28196 RepID=UPI00100B6BBA